MAKDKTDVVEAADGGKAAGADAAQGPVDGAVETLEVTAEEAKLGPGPYTCVPVYMRRMWGREVPGVTPEALAAGPVCVAMVTLRDGVDLNLLADAVRDGYCGELPEGDA